MYRNVTTESLPIHRVFEMRGTLFHEIQAHKLALMDLGKAIALNPSRYTSYYLCMHIYILYNSMFILDYILLRTL